jgi:hypothetical protein
MTNVKGIMANGNLKYVITRDKMPLPSIAVWAAFHRE